MGKSLTNPIHVEVGINGKPLSMEVDMGAAVSLISYKKLKQVLPRIKIRKTTVVLRTYMSEVIPVRGEVQVNVTYAVVDLGFCEGGLYNKNDAREYFETTPTFSLATHTRNQICVF